MKLLNFSFAFMLLLALPAFASGKLAFENQIHNFGNIKMESKVMYTFRFTNRGDKTLNITRVRAGCSCTGTLVTKKSVKPGESGEVKVELYTDRRLGELTKSVYVYSDDPEHGKIRLVLLANVVEK